jgi:hypothetical protein
MAEAAALGVQARIPQIMFPGDAGELAQLRGAELAIRHGHTQHGGVALHVPTVLQAQRAEFLAAQFAREVALQLIPVLGGPGMDELAVECGVTVHGGWELWCANECRGKERAGSRKDRTVRMALIFQNNK